MAKTTLAARLRAVEDIAAVKLLKAQYLNAADGGWTKKSHNGPLVARMFTKDGSWESKGFPRAVGHKAIRKLFSMFRRDVPIAVHITANPIVRVKGDTATGEWRVMVMHADAQGRDSFTVAYYTDTFIRTRAGWKFTSLYAEPCMHGPYADGWTRLVAAVMAAPPPKRRRRKK
jgi:hypothetical protein